MSENIWDRCEALSLPDRKWTSNPEAQLSIDAAVKSPLGTGSIRIFEPATTGAWNTIAFCTFLGGNKDFTTKRPKSAFVYTTKAMQFMLEIICRPGGAWLERFLTDWFDVPVATMTELVADYANVSSEELREVYQFRVFARTDQQEAIFFISGITEETIAECAIDADCEALYGLGYICQNGVCILAPTPPPTHMLAVNSMPIQGISIIVKKVA